MLADNHVRCADCCFPASGVDRDCNGISCFEALGARHLKSQDLDVLSQIPSIVDGSSTPRAAAETVAGTEVAFKERIRVVVVDDHHLVREGVVSLLNAVNDIEVVAEAADGIEATTQIRKHHPNIALLDLRMPRMGGLEVIQRIRSESLQVRFIVLTSFDGEEDVYRAMQAGASAYLLKGATAKEMVKTIRSIHAGYSYFPPRLHKSSRSASEERS